MFPFTQSKFMLNEFSDDVLQTIIEKCDLRSIARMQRTCSRVLAVTRNISLHHSRCRDAIVHIRNGGEAEPPEGMSVSCDVVGSLALCACHSRGRMKHIESIWHMTAVRAFPMADNIHGYPGISYMPSDVTRDMLMQIGTPLELLRLVMVTTALCARKSIVFEFDTVVDTFEMFLHKTTVVHDTRIPFIIRRFVEICGFSVPELYHFLMIPPVANVALFREEGSGSNIDGGEDSDVLSVSDILGVFSDPPPMEVPDGCGSWEPCALCKCAECIYNYANIEGFMKPSGRQMSAIITPTASECRTHNNLGLFTAFVLEHGTMTSHRTVARHGMTLAVPMFVPTPRYPHRTKRGETPDEREHDVSVGARVTRSSSSSRTCGVKSAAIRNMWFWLAKMENRPTVMNSNQ